MSNPAIIDPNSSLPQGWQWVRLGEILELHDNGLWGSHDPVSGIPVIRSVNFCNDGSISTEDIARIQPSTQNTQNKRLRKGDILLERSGGGPKQPVGRVVLFDLDEKFYFGNFISRLRCKPDVDSSFLFFQLFNIHMKGGTLLLQDQTTGIRNLRFTEYLQLPIALSSLPEQKRIAAKVQELMAEVERTRTDCEAQLEAAKALSSAYLRQVFESEEVKRWERGRLGELFYVQQGVAMSPKRREGISPHPFLRTLNVLWGHVDLSMLDQMDFTDEEVAKLSLKPGDLLVCEGGEVGRTAIWRGELEGCLYQNHIHRLRWLSDNVVPDFYVYWMQAAFQVFESYSGQESKTTIPNLSGSRLKSFTVPLPPVEEQGRIASDLKAKMAQAEKLKESIENQLEAINALPQAILRKAFSGEL